MKKIPLFLASVVSLAVLTACGGRSSDYGDTTQAHYGDGYEDGDEEEADREEFFRERALQEEEAHAEEVARMWGLQ